jgi:succinate dehydrogenase / fumarate reductase flavoprotein subunit
MPEHDVVVVGGGIAGLRAALAAQRAGANAAVVSKLHPVRSHSAGTRAGCAALVWQTPGRHAADTIRASDYLADQGVGSMQEGVDRNRHLDHLGALFNRGADKRPQLRRLPGSSRPRSCFIDDRLACVAACALSRY